jgi:hypothetical protein
MLSMINGSAQRSIGLTGESMPDRAEVNSAIVRCCTRVVPLRTVNERLNRDAMPDGQWCWPLFSLRINAPVISSMRAHTNDRIALASFEGRRLMNSRRSFVVLTHPLDKQKLTLGG